MAGLLDSSGLDDAVDRPDSFARLDRTKECTGCVVVAFADVSAVLSANESGVATAFVRAIDACFGSFAVSANDWAENVEEDVPSGRLVDAFVVIAAFVPRSSMDG
jgi:hypothetical protein